ncbi:hypothetical protein PCASD_18912 [Puccinia coronata f. sp. avenae]|uniref:JmjC domain-containing protein n=1 Tax=Puccinia coronata f. sp. avenae TaxID=200324 RepID=A0A2N5T9N3_9BASI|nr:hypothetical protein PCASD_18912 [Puccinia coronata f. sp. avenae]
MDALGDEPSYATFLNEYLLPNRPVLFRSKKVLEWPASKNWTHAADADGLQGRENLAAVAMLYGHLQVPVVKQRITPFSHDDAHKDALVDREWCQQISSQDNDCMDFRDVVDCWQKKSHYPIRHDGQQEAQITADEEEEVIYVKDWHLMRICEQTFASERGDRDAPPNQDGSTAAPLYRVPEIFLDDWMNDYYSAETQDDFRFVYMGERGTMTGLHTDVYNSYSWSANIVGKKRWRLFDPESTESLTIEQSRGEIIFVPSGWKHEVMNLSPLVISINHNWCNSVNLPSVYGALAKDIEQVKESIEDVKSLLKKKWDRTRSESSASPEDSPPDSGWELEWIEVVQELTKQHSGWNWTTFWEMVRFIARRDFKTASSTSPSPPTSQSIHPFSPPLQFVKAQISSCLTNFKTRDEFVFDSTLKQIIHDIEACLSVVN